MRQIIKTAFTLIELLVVIAIIGILSGLIIVTMNGVTSKANIAKAKVFSSSLKNALMMNLVSEWKFDGTTADGSPATANDVKDTWKNINNGTVPYPPTVETSDCVSGSCLEFSGAAASGAYNYVDFGNNSSLSMGTGDATVSLWVKFDNDIAPQIETLIWCGGGYTGGDGYWIFRNTGTNKLNLSFTDGTSSLIQNYLSSNSSLMANNWYNIVVVFDRDISASAYINGVRQTQSVDVTSEQGDVQNVATYKIGAWSASYYRLDGKMDEVRVYNAAMPTSQIKEHYYLGLNNLLGNGSISKEEYLERINNVARK